MRITAFILICSLSLSAYAQYIDVQAGFSFASGSFGNNKLSKEEDGFATTGFTSGMQVGYLVYKNLGICAKVNYSTFGFNNSSYQDQVNTTASQGTSVEVKNNADYKSTSALAGAYITLGKQNFTFDIRLMTGFLSLANTGLTYTTSYSGQQYTESLSSERDAAIAFGWGLTAKYALPKNLYLSLNLDDIYANTEFNRNSYYSSNKNKITKPYESYLLTLGIGYAIQ